jgi:SRSO17 transposase
MLSEKKIFHFFIKSYISVSYIIEHVKSYRRFFRAHRFDNTDTAINYALGLLKCEKGQANMERMEEEIDQSDYRAYQQFISNSNWDCDGLLQAVAQDTSVLFSAQKEINKLPVGYIIDESGHLKKGKKSVGVSRQYAGVAGKVDNCQIGVYASLVNHKSAAIINQHLFLPKSWTDDATRCEQAGIPKEHRNFKTKPELAIKMLKQDIERGVTFDWIGGDGLYGHSYELCKSIDEMNLFFVLDVHKDETVFEQEPKIEVPERQSNRGKTPTNLKADKSAIRLDKLIGNIPEHAWRKEEIRETTTGKLYLYVYKTEVWSWDGKEAAARKRTLIITKTTESTPRIKYSFSNGELDQYSHQEYGYFVAQRYWVERSFDDAKNELGLSDYQTRKWTSWQHHHSLVMLTMLFVVRQQIENQEETPLLSFRDTRILIILQVFGTPEQIQQKLNQMEKRHKSRQYNIDRKYKKQSDSQVVISS